MSEQEKNVNQEAEQIVDKIKELVKKGNISKIAIKKDGETVVSLPVNVGIIGAVVGAAAAPWTLLVAAIATVGLDCTVELSKTDGTVVDIGGKTIGKKVVDTGAAIVDCVADDIREAVQNPKSADGDAQDK